MSNPYRFLVAAMLAGAGVSAQAAERVTPETYNRAEADFAFAKFQKIADGKPNQFFFITKPTPLDGQIVVRMNRDTLYAAAIVDTEGGATVTIPAFPDNRYFSVLVLDNDHYAPQVFYTPGSHKISSQTKYVAVIQRIQMRDPHDAQDIALINKLQKQFTIQAASADPFPEPKWDRDSMLALRAQYEPEFQKFTQFPPDLMGPRGEVNEQIRHLASAGGWGLFPQKDAVYINYTGPRDASQCYVATYQVPENKAFWSITVYGRDGYMMSENSIINDRNVQLNVDGGFTVHYGSEHACGKQPNRLDITEGWNFVMRVYRPGESLLKREYKMPEVSVVQG